MASRLASDDHPEDQVALDDAEQPSDSNEDDPVATEPSAYFFGRFGTFFLDVMHSKRGAAATHDQLVGALKSDSRVVQVVADPIRPQWSRKWISFPEDTKRDADDLLSGRDHFHPFEMSDPVCFEVYVPIKNQPMFRGVDDIPTDRYWAAWDGITLVVIWERKPEERYPARSAGHIVEDVLRTAAEKISSGLVVQACSPGCTNMFAHRDLRITQTDLEPEQTKRIRFDGTHPRVVEAALRFTGDQLAVARALYARIESPSSQFASFKNLSRRIIDIEHLARSMVDELLSLDYRNLEDSRANVFKRVGNWFASSWRAMWGKGDSRRSRQLIASLWIAMSRIESLKRDWLGVQRLFSEYSSRQGRAVLYDIDRKDDDVAVQAIDTQFVRAAVEHKSARRDNRVVVWATIGGATAGALAALATAAVSLSAAGS